MRRTQPFAGPLMPLGASYATIHAILDHEILETIVNNRTAMVTYHKLPSAIASDVKLFGLDQLGLEGTLQTWLLKSANNLPGTP